MMEDYAFLALHNEELATTDDSSTEVDLAPYIHVGGREIKGILAVQASTDSTSDDTVTVNFQESATTASSDFADITGATFTAVAFDSMPANQSIHFQAAKRYVRTRALSTATKVGIVSGVFVIDRATT